MKESEPIKPLEIKGACTRLGYTAGHVAELLEIRTNVNRYFNGKTIDLSTASVIIKSSNSQTDGGAGSGNFGHADFSGQVGGNATKGAASPNGSKTK